MPRSLSPTNLETTRSTRSAQTTPSRFSNYDDQHLVITENDAIDLVTIKFTDTHQVITVNHDDGGMTLVFNGRSQISI